MSHGISVITALPIFDELLPLSGTVASVYGIEPDIVLKLLFRLPFVVGTITNELGTKIEIVSSINDCHHIARKSTYLVLIAH